MLNTIRQRFDPLDTGDGPDTFPNGDLLHGAKKQGVMETDP